MHRQEVGIYIVSSVALCTEIWVEEKPIIWYSHHLWWEMCWENVWWNYESNAHVCTDESERLCKSGLGVTYTVSQEQFWPITKPTRNFIFDIILRQPYKLKYDSPQNICLPLFEFSPPPWGGNHLSLKNIHQTFIVGSFILIIIYQSALYTAYISFFDHWLPEYASAHSSWEGEMMKPSIFGG